MSSATKSQTKFEHPLFQEGIAYERERIIKLLEPYANAKCDELCDYRCECYGKYEAKHFIALIKGENK